MIFLPAEGCSDPQATGAADACRDHVPPAAFCRHSPRSGTQRGKRGAGLFASANLPVTAWPRVHLVGAAGAGMRALAALLQGAGCRLSGSDAASHTGDWPDWLRSEHAAAHLPADCELLVYSAAVARDNPELMAARQRRIPALSYPEMVGRLMAGRVGLAVAGTHGKSTTTAMTAAILAAAGIDASVLVGATGVGSGASSRFGGGPWLLAEACEYRSHFHHLRPQAAVLLGVEWDHVDCFPTVTDVEHAFAGFVAGLVTGGVLLVADRCPRARRIARQAGRRFESFGLRREADWRATRLEQVRGRFRFELSHCGRPLTTVALQVPGLHNVENALAAAALAWHSGAGAAAIRQGLGEFRGLKRRLEWLGPRRGIFRIDDYAHHPTEVAASLAALRIWFGPRRICCVFQPHQAARTAALLDEFAGSMHNADLVAVAEVYRAREPAHAPGATAADLAGRLAARGIRVAPSHAIEEIQAWLRGTLCPGDVLVTMGAGDIGKFAHEFV